jgi:transcriptional regulator with XRE-family HTH domain
MTDDDSPSSVERTDDVSVGESLARVRRAAKLTGQQLGKLAGMSQAKVSRIETGAVSVDPKDVQILAQALKMSREEESRLVERAARSHNRMTDWQPTQANVVDRQLEFVRMEAETRTFRVFQPAVIVGLLQTSEYARAILSRFQLDLIASRTGEAPGVVSEAVSARVRRHEVLADRRKHFHFVMTETVLNNRVCRPTDMLAQIDRLREVSKQDNVTLGIIPADAPLSIPTYHGFELLDDRYVMVDLYNTTMLSHGRADTSLYRQVFDNLEERVTAEVDEMLDKYFQIYFDLSRPRARTASEPGR